MSELLQNRQNLCKTCALVLYCLSWLGRLSCLLIQLVGLILWLSGLLVSLVLLGRRSGVLFLVSCFDLACLAILSRSSLRIIIVVVLRISLISLLGLRLGSLELLGLCLLFGRLVDALELLDHLLCLSDLLHAIATSWYVLLVLLVLLKLNLEL